MSLSFPASPTNGQIYQGFIWNASVGAWQPNFAAQFVTSVDGATGVVNLTGRRIELMRQVVVATTPVAWVQFVMSLSTYDEYEVVGYGLVPTVTSNVNPVFQVGTGAGPTWDNTASYGYTVIQQDTAASPLYSTGGSAQTWGILGPGHGANTAFYASNWWLRMFQPGHPTRRKMFTCEAIAENSSAFLNSKYTTIWWPASTPPLTGLRFGYTSGNVSEGTFVVYGVIK